MSKFVNEVSEIANEIIERKFKVSDFEALQIAAKIQQNRLFSEAYLLGHGEPSALEQIAMELGASKDGSSIKHALIDLKD